MLCGLGMQQCAMHNAMQQFRRQAFLNQVYKNLFLQERETKKILKFKNMLTTYPRLRKGEEL